MARVFAILLVAGIALGPAAVLVGVAVLAGGLCAPPASSGVPADPDVPETRRIVLPVPVGSYTISDGFGLRQDPFDPSKTQFHRGTDFAAADGTPIFAVADGIVMVAAMLDGLGWIQIRHTVDGGRVTTAYLHMWEDGILVAPGQWVDAGEIIGLVGSSGPSTGSHLQLEVWTGTERSAAVDPLEWLAAHDAEGLTGGEQRCATPEPAPESPAPTPEPVGAVRRGLP